jgi:hypothetical protein
LFHWSFGSEGPQNQRTVFFGLLSTNDRPLTGSNWGELSLLQRCSADTSRSHSYAILVPALGHALVATPRSLRAKQASYFHQTNSQACAISRCGATLPNHSFRTCGVAQGNRMLRRPCSQPVDGRSADLSREIGPSSFSGDIQEVKEPRWRTPSPASCRWHSIPAPATSQCGKPSHAGLHTQPCLKAINASQG